MHLVAAHAKLLFRTESVPYQYYYSSGGYSHTDYQTRFHSRPSASGGPAGMCGRAPVDALQPGQNGPPGFSQITVLFSDGGSATYSSRYILEIVGFDVQDENDDGINEPGEYVFVTNIVIKNTGKRQGHHCKPIFPQWLTATRSFPSRWNAFAKDCKASGFGPWHEVARTRR